MKTARKSFAILLLVLTLPIWFLQLVIRNFMSLHTLWNFADSVENSLETQLFAFPEVSNAGQFLSSIAWIAKFFEALILPFCIVVSVQIIRNATKKKITLIPAIVLLIIALFDLICIVVANFINNIEIIELSAELLRYKNVSVDILHPVIDPSFATINSALLSIPAIGFLTCGIIDIMYLKKNPEGRDATPVDSKLKKSRLFYSLSTLSIVAVLMVASIISANSKIATITWIFRYFWQGYIFFIIAAIVFYVIGNSLNPIKKTKKDRSTPVQVSVQQVSSADELKKFKELFDQGIITQEEFDAKKKQLLGL